MRRWNWLALIALLVVSGVACGADEGAAERKAGAALARSLQNAIDASTALRAPFRCARLSANRPVVAPGMSGSWSVEGDILKLNAKAMRLGIIADARGAAQRESLARLGEALAAQEIDLLVSLGGLGTTREEIRAALEPLAARAPYPILAIPGDRESVSAHRSAIRQLQAQNFAILDGSRARLVQMGGTLLVAVPGLDDDEHLVAGTEGCMHTEEDLVGLADRARAVGLPVLWLSYAPPRQYGAQGTDFGASGIHVGSTVMAQALERSGAKVAVHAMVEGPPEQGRHSLQSDTPLLVSSGSLEGAPSALMVSVDRNRVEYRPILAP